MPNLQGQTFAQRLHALKYGDIVRDCQPDALDLFMQDFEQNQKRVGAKAAYRIVTEKHGRTYKSYHSFVVARNQYYANRDRGRKPMLNNAYDKAQYLQDKRAKTYNRLDPYWLIVDDTRSRGKTNYEAWRLAEEWHVGAKGYMRYSSEASYKRGRSNYMKHNGKAKADTSLDG